MSLKNKLDTIHSNVPQVHQAGKDQQRIAMWDYYQQGGARTDYDSAFTGYMWDKNSFYPVYNIQPTRANMMFFWFGFPANKNADLVESVDLVERLNECGVTLDFSKCAEMWRAFSYCKINHVGVIDFANCRHTRVFDDAGNEVDQNPQPWDSLFRNSQIETIDKLVFYFYNPPFKEKWLPKRLVEVKAVEGVIQCGGLNFSECENVTRETILRFFNALADMTTEANASYAEMYDHIITLGEVNAAKLTDADKAIATNKGWTLA